MRGLQMYYRPLKCIPTLEVNTYIMPCTILTPSGNRQGDVVVYFLRPCAHVSHFLSAQVLQYLPSDIDENFTGNPNDHWKLCISFVCIG